jgi:hypothetical protein
MTMNDTTFDRFVAAVESACGRELDIEWDGESREVTFYSDLSGDARESIEVIGQQMGVAVAWS